MNMSTVRWLAIAGAVAASAYPQQNKLVDLYAPPMAWGPWVAACSVFQAASNLSDFGEVEKGDTHVEYEYETWDCIDESGRDCTRVQRTAKPGVPIKWHQRLRMRAMGVPLGTPVRLTLI
jgi:hypothetical protein